MVDVGIFFLVIKLLITSMFLFAYGILLQLVLVSGGGILLLYRPKDVSHECVFSHELRYDLSFGMGMSDTITLVFRTLNEIDYECSIEIVNESEAIHLLVVIKYPNIIGINCVLNKNAFVVIKKNQHHRVCDHLQRQDLSSPYYVFSVRGRVKFHFASNSSINTDMKSYLYQVTATASRRKPLHGCNKSNETICIVNHKEYCFTSGVVCDGIKNCGISDWFDERKSQCGLPVKKLDIAPVLTVTAVIFFILVAGTHMLLQWLPPLANSFFIFNVNEDNRLYTAPQLKPPEHMPIDKHQNKKTSLIPTYSSSASSDDVSNEQSENIARELRSLSMVPEFSYPSLAKLEQERQNPSRRTMTEIKNKLLKIVNNKTKNNLEKHSKSSFIV